MPEGHYTERVGARAELASLIKTKYPTEAKAAGLTVADLDVLITQGQLAHQADRDQHEQLAVISGERSGRAEAAKSCFAREEGLRSRLPAVVADLAVSHPELSDWLSRVSFARYRFRELAVADAAKTDAAKADAAKTDAAKTEVAAEIARVERVERADISTRLDGLGALCFALGKPGREPIIAAFEARDLTGAAIAQLGADADTLAKEGKNKQGAAEATARESAAVAAQRKKWGAARQMIRRLAAKHDDLKAKLGDC